MPTLDSFDTYHINGYEISDDIEFFYSLWNITPEMYNAIEKSGSAATSGKSSGYNRIAKAVKKYPNVPVFKDQMVMYFTVKEEFDKANQWTEKLLREHPDFMMGYVGKAISYFSDDEFEKMREIMGGNFELRELISDRKVFFYEEFLQMQYIAVLYFGATGQIDQALDRLDLMEQVGPDEVVTQISRDFLNGEFYDDESIEDDEMGELEESVREQLESSQGAPQPETTKTEPPEFIHDEVWQLYEYGFELPYDSIIEIATLPRESLIKDLETMLDDSIERYTYLTEEDWEVNSCFVTHALFLLAEINAVESAPKIYKVLSQSAQYMEDFLDDVFRHEAHDPFYKLLSGEPEKLVDFIKKPDVFIIPRIVALSLLMEIVFQKPEQKLKILGYFDEIIDFFIASNPEDNVHDKILMDALVADLLIIEAVNFLPKIRQLIDQDMTFSFQESSREELLSVMNTRGTEEVHQKLPLRPMIKTYETLGLDNQEEEWDEEWEDDEFDEGFDEMFDNFLNNPETKRSIDYDEYSSEVMHPVRTEPKVGRRNDPCPCGSGKKYKKCCLGKEK